MIATIYLLGDCSIQIGDYSLQIKEMNDSKVITVWKEELEAHL